MMAMVEAATRSRHRLEDTTWFSLGKEVNNRTPATWATVAQRAVKGRSTNGQETKRPEYVLWPPGACRHYTDWGLIVHLAQRPRRIAADVDILITS